MPGLPKESIHLSVYSPPFGGLYQYSSSERDLSNSDNYEQFFKHYEYIVREISRLTLPGRMTGVHCMDVVTGNTGCDHFIDFPGDIIRLHQKLGWHYTARHCIWKEPLTVRNRTLAKHLMHTTIVHDSTHTSPALPDYLIIFRKRGTNPIPVTHARGLMNYAGEREMPAELLKFRGYEGDQIYNRYSHWIWRQYASAFWDDIRVWRTVDYLNSKEPDDEKHVHPLQLDVIERCLDLYSNPGENVLSPFMGVGSELCAAIANERRGIGIELKASYYHQAERNLEYTAKNGLQMSSPRSMITETEPEEDQQSILLADSNEM